MSNDVNVCNFIGRLGNPPETRYMANGEAVTSFSLAVGSSWKNKDGEKQESTEWVNITAFGKLAEICSEYLAKGSQVYISGRMKTDKYQAKDGTDRYSTKIIADRMQMLGAKGEQERQQPSPTQSTNPPKSMGTSGMDNFDNDLPFMWHGAPGAGVSWRAM